MNVPPVSPKNRTLGPISGRQGEFLFNPLLSNRLSMEEKGELCIPRDRVEAESEQNRLRKVLSRPLPPVSKIRRIAGADVAYGRSRAYAAVAVMECNRPRIVMRAEASSNSLFPYIPGLFALREIPPLCEVFTLVRPFPDLLIAHGHGYAHPRRMGMATHLGMILGVPTIGVAETLLHGMSAESPDEERGSRSAVYMDGERVGTSIRTRAGSRPVFVSAGYRTTLPIAERIALRCTTEGRLPDPLRFADRKAREFLARSHRLGE